MVEPKARRKKQFIDRDVQGALVFRLALHWCVFLVVGMSVSLVLQYLADPFQPAGHHFGLFAKNQAGFLLVMVCMTPIFLFDTVKLSHRFAGPVLRVRRALREMAGGEEAERVTLRPGDFWIEIAEDLNKVIDRVSKLEGHQESDVAQPAEGSDAQQPGEWEEVAQV